MSDDDVETFPTKWECSCHPEYVKLPVVVSERHALEMLEDQDPPGCLALGGLQEPPKNSPIKPPHMWNCFCKQKELLMIVSEKRVVVYLDVDEYPNMLKEFPSRWLCNCHEEICLKLPVVVDYKYAVKKMIASLHPPIPIAFGAAKGPPTQMLFPKGVVPPPQKLFCKCMAKTYGMNDELLVYFDSETYCSKNNLSPRILVDGTEAIEFNDRKDQKDNTIHENTPPAKTSSAKSDKSVIWNTSLESIKYISDDDCDDDSDYIFTDESDLDEEVFDVSENATTMDNESLYSVNHEAQDDCSDVTMKQSAGVSQLVIETPRGEPLFALMEEPLFEYDDSVPYTPYLLKNAMTNNQSVCSMGLGSLLKGNVDEEAIIQKDAKDERNEQVLNQKIQEEPLFEFDDSPPYCSSLGHYYSMNVMDNEEKVYLENNDASHNSNVTETMNPIGLADVSGNNGADNVSQETTGLHIVAPKEQSARDAEDEVLTAQKAEAVSQMETEDDGNQQLFDLNVKEEMLFEFDDSPHYSSLGHYYDMNAMTKETIYSESSDASHNAIVTEAMNPHDLVAVSGNDEHLSGSMRPSLYSDNCTDNVYLVSAEEASQESKEMLHSVIFEKQSATDDCEEVVIGQKCEVIPQMETEHDGNQKLLDRKAKEKSLFEAVDQKRNKESEAIAQVAKGDGNEPLFDLNIAEGNLFEVDDPRYDSHRDVNWGEPLFEDASVRCSSQGLDDWMIGYNAPKLSIKDSVHKIEEKGNSKDFPSKRRRIRRSSNSSVVEVDEKTSEYYEERGLYVEPTHFAQKIVDPAILERITRKREMRRMVKDHIRQQDSKNDKSLFDRSNYRKGFSFNDETTEKIRQKFEEQSKLVSDKLAEKPVDGFCNAGRPFSSDHDALLRSMHSSSISGVNLSSYNLTSVTQVEMAAKHGFVPWSALTGLPYRGYIAHKMASEADPMAMELNKLSNADKKSKNQNPSNVVKELVLRKKAEMLSRLGRNEFIHRTPMESVNNQPMEHSTEPAE